MKAHIHQLLLLAGLLALPNNPAKAQEKPDAPPPAKPEQSDAPPARGRPRGDAPPPRVSEQSQERPVSYIGVLTSPVSHELRAQFGFADGFGLQVVEVMPDSPAQQAGLKVHDVLVSFEDQKLVNMEQLQTLVRSKKKDENIALTVITGGQQKQITVKVGERLARVEIENRQRGGFGPMMPPWAGGPFGQSGMNPEQWRDRVENYQREMREYQEHLQKWLREGRGGPMPQPPMLDISRPHPGMDHSGRGPVDGNREKNHREREVDEKRRDMERRETEHHPRRRDGPHEAEMRQESRSHHEASSVTRSDEGGIYRLSREGDRSIFSVKPREGEVREWPVNTEEERAALPEPLRAKLRELEEIRKSARPADGAPDRGPGGPPPGRHPEGA